MQMPAHAVIVKKLRDRQIKRNRDFRQRIERGNGMPVLDPRKIAAQQPRLLLDVTLRESPVQPVRANRGADLHPGSSPLFKPRQSRATILKLFTQELTCGTCLHKRKTRLY